jgi:hypothetical protein
MRQVMRVMGTELLRCSDFPGVSTAASLRLAEVMSFSAGLDQSSVQSSRKGIAHRVWSKRNREVRDWEGRGLTT